ncbi:MAG: ribosomal RNA small subunit methyltransferase A [Candidatus Taylorbacteria bacterium RIFCSPHIGHO2_02_49_25]|uniref:Ribosomal RNA small subunit methyltransferase A n=1 Tax=Candidatus Taylorbacteria bacterium RIFCSPHIGHO2_02_49_25 TaxID=1802305 RepID=A0A1G2MGK1_9BACT|nr:MAG: Ribosomal RNA small subunit methyltransferase A [Parcubacteria group bacterium GW2011_GWF2_50_9]OHA20679.1 MAG: ribosomal RNA small subunit methyltransferase A [Candidatus Taylorbacteria bacterium RIFCSPHIGHO2_01_FULL_49_60]OHA22299.1 MAG: ribosomal RNA small subunit methyltransferase A [Candidatus Taylorbacteria bacterium RIFCSPHIGHO2_02_49_25]OHA35785.1 MAG: ribosomal RNA small subunit methyltransferase A [Candidatus Taylorbacteria bacterium RIFCSPLOWO2_02_50_13]OHA36990.1 MAG: riboso
MLHKKSLGQHFLRSKAALFNIAEAANLSRADTALEVGPGEGTLTELLLARAGKVVAVEKDDRLMPILRQKFAADIASGKLHLIHADILSFSPSHYSLLATRYKIVANIPYYITGAFLKRFLQTETRSPELMVLLLQKEVARRIVATDGKESILSMSVKAYGHPAYIGSVKAGAFSPPPKVDSAIIAIENISKSFFSDGLVEPPTDTRSDLVKKKERRFFELLKKGFAHPRKFVASNLGVPTEKLKECGVRDKARPENLSVKDWKCLSASFRDS